MGSAPGVHLHITAMYAWAAFGAAVAALLTFLPSLAMNVALPEIDGRILSRAVSFKTALGRDRETEADLVGYQPVADRIDFVANLAQNWFRRKHTRWVMKIRDNDKARLWRNAPANFRWIDGPAVFFGALKPFHVRLQIMRDIQHRAVRRMLD